MTTMTTITPTTITPTMITPTSGPRSLRRRGLARLALGAGGAAVVLAGLTAVPAVAADTGSATLESIRQCESGGDYTAVNASSGASGAYQFLESTWQSLGAAAGYSTAAGAPESVQDAAALELFARQGGTPWAASESCWSGTAATTDEAVAATDQVIEQETVSATAAAETESATADAVTEPEPAPVTEPAAPSTQPPVSQTAVEPPITRDPAAATATPVAASAGPAPAEIPAASGC